jgi:hypothetical protein
MADTEKDKNKNAKTRLKPAFRDLAVILIVSTLIFVLTYFFDVFIFIVRFLEKYPDKIIYVDEIITALLTFSIGFAIFSWRRWLELKEETADRIAAQEALVKLTETKAEVERIINKQLKNEIEARTDIEKELFKIIHSKEKNI